MSQIFGGDAVGAIGPFTLTNGVAVAVVTGNFLTPPFGNCKARVRGSAYITLGSVPTNVNVILVRNPSGDNTTIASTGGLTGIVAAGAVMEVFLEFTDSIPDGRQVQYQLQINAAGTGTNGSAGRAYVEADLLSG